MCYTYILKCSDGTYYTGWTNDLDKRLKAHNGGKSGAKYTRNRRPVTLVYYEEFQGKQEAMKREYAIKQLTRTILFIIKMISQSLSDINIHKNKVACTSCHHEQMEDLM